MTSPFLLGDLASDEGLRLRAYPDPLSPRGRELAKPMIERVDGWQKLSGDPWTIGYGHARGVKEGDVWTLEQANAALKADVADVEATLDKHISWWRQLTDFRQDVIAALCFNLGWPTFSTFTTFLGLVDRYAYDAAATDLLCTKAGRELPQRYARLATQLRTGVRAA